MAVAEIESYQECVSEMLSSSTEHWRVVTSSPKILTEIVESLDDDKNKQIDWLCNQDVYRQFEEDFFLATEASDLIAEDILTVRSSADDESQSPTLLLSEEECWNMLLLDGDSNMITRISDDQISAHLWEYYDSKWEIAVPYSIDTPPYSRLLVHAEHELGETVRDDIQKAYTAVKNRSPTDQMDPVSVALLVAAKHELPLTHVVDWVEKTKLATQGTVSKNKNELEDAGIITTESENVGVGRPRQRLLFSDDMFQTMSADELIANAQTVI